MRSDLAWLSVTFPEDKVSAVHGERRKCEKREKGSASLTEIEYSKLFVFTISTVVCSTSWPMPSRGSILELVDQAYSVSSYSAQGVPVSDRAIARIRGPRIELCLSVTGVLTLLPDRALLLSFFFVFQIWVAKVISTFAKSRSGTNIYRTLERLPGRASEQVSSTLTEKLNQTSRL